VPSDEVGVKVGQEDTANRATQPRGVLYVLLDVPLGINDGRLAALQVSDEVRGVGQAVEVVPREEERSGTIDGFGLKVRRGVADLNGRLFLTLSVAHVHT
jgi:hypothetical protein